MKKKQKKDMLNDCLSDKGTAKLNMQFFRLKKKTDLNISTRSNYERLWSRSKNLQSCIIRTWKYIHSGWSFKQYLKFDYRMRHIHYYFKSKMFISLLKSLRFSQSTVHIPQVRSTCHCSKDELPNHTDSSLSNRAFCKEFRACKHF